jgi:predicted DNA-binding transcriptional regulator AlpA
MFNGNQPHATESLALLDREAAQLFQVSTRHWWQLDKLGRIPRPIRLGRSVRWSRVEIEAWLAAGAPPRDEWERIKSNGGGSQ